MKINTAMAAVLADVVFAAPLCPALSTIAGSGFDVRDDCHFLAALFPSAKNVTRNNFS
ncbi:hypothetical protein [Pandoraea sp. SD6-2]|uniref:hypothetical protein n=1 Tax=Pandoraea sp. SD6-2 TaxID=1286093 RepID=UPI001438A9E7|nr:hypothetical protein [Pandoraea sp. SD6-2]